MPLAKVLSTSLGRISFRLFLWSSHFSPRVSRSLHISAGPALSPAVVECDIWQIVVAFASDAQVPGPGAPEGPNNLARALSPPSTERHELSPDCNTEEEILNTQYSILNTQCSILNTQCSI
jgi:hypothetical protein